jgi:hypothetical protein
MKNLNLFYLLLFLLSFNSLNAQDSTQITKKTSPKASYFSFGLGGSLPLGKFGQASTNKQGIGFSSNGFSYRAEFGFIGHKYWGFGLMAGGFSNTINAGLFAENNDFKPFLGDGPYVYSLNGKKGRYNGQFYFVGPMATLPLKNILIDFKAMAGLLSTQFPAFSFTVSDPVAQSGETFIVKSDKSKIAFAYNLGANIRLKMKNNIQFITSFEYILSKPELSYSVNEFYRFKNFQSVTMLNINWGLAFGF